MIYFRHVTTLREVHIYPFVCWHIGAPQSDAGFIRSMIDRVAADPVGLWIYMGDGGECVTKQSKGDIYKQLFNPMEQQNVLVDLLKPIQDKGLFGVRGNHGHRIYKETGLDWDETLLARVGIPYLDVDAFWHLKLGNGSEHPAIFSIYTHHGVDSGVSLASKVNKARSLDVSIDADAILTAHSHIALDMPPRYTAYLGDMRGVENPIRWKETREYICGSAYDSRTGYAAEKGYPPILPSHLMISFRAGPHGEKKQDAYLYRKEDL